VRYYKLLAPWKTFQGGGGTQARAQVRTEAERWLADYPAFAHTREGQHLRYMLVQVYAAEFTEMDEVRRKTPAGVQLIDRALAQVDILEGGGDYAQEA